MFRPRRSDVGEPQIYTGGVAAQNSGSSTGTSGLSAHCAPTPLIGSVHQMHWNSVLPLSA
jgi:hypothetical protein